MRACVVFNPGARGTRARWRRAALQALAPSCPLLATHRPGHAMELAAAAVREGFDTVVAAGGDGTVNEVVEGLAGVPGALDTVRLGVLPLGTMNVFARELGLPHHPAAAWQVIQHGVERRLDLPRLEWGAPERRAGRHFVQLAGAGLDARAIARVNPAAKVWTGPLAYALAGWQAWRGPQPRVEAATDAARQAGELVLIGNGRFYAGPLPVFPGAQPDDGWLEVLVFERVTALTLLRFAVAWLARRPFRAARTHALRTGRLELTATEPVPIEVDGEHVGFTPGTITLRPRALRVLVPPGPGGAVA